MEIISFILLAILVLLLITILLCALVGAVATAWPRTSPILTRRFSVEAHEPQQENGDPPGYLNWRRGCLHIAMLFAIPAAIMLGSLLFVFENIPTQISPPEAVTTFILFVVMFFVLIWIVYFAVYFVVRLIVKFIAKGFLDKR